MKLPFLNLQLCFVRELWCVLRYHLSPSPLSLSPSHVQLSCEIKRVQSGEFFPLPSEEEVERLHKVGRATSSCVHATPGDNGFTC